MYPDTYGHNYFVIQNKIKRKKSLVHKLMKIYPNNNVAKFVGAKKYLLSNKQVTCY